MAPLSAEEFDALMAGLGPFEPAPVLAVAVSGGADSLALALLADRWARARGGAADALIVDHGLRAESAGEAAEASGRLRGHGIAARILPLHGLARGPGLAARARAARYAALRAACAASGRLHLLLGHHAADQAETIAMRLLAGSGAEGLAGMPAVRETAEVRLLRPLLPVPPGRLRATLREAGLSWAEDPSNTDPAAQRARLRLARRDRDGAGPATLAAGAAAAARGRARAAGDWRRAALAARVGLAAEGYALLPPGPIDPVLLASLIRAVSGAAWPPSPEQTAALAARLHPATLGGAHLLPAGRLRPGGWLLVREAAAMQPPVPAGHGAVWDGRFRLESAAKFPPATTLGGLGAAARQVRHLSGLPAAVLAMLPALWQDDEIVAIPHLGISKPGRLGPLRLCPALETPPCPAAFLAFGMK